MNDERVREIHERTRRIETRLTKLVEAMGVDTGASKPVWLDNHIDLPSVAASFKDVINAIPDDWPSDQTVPVLYRGIRIAAIKKA